jgi:CO dehydrogenase/acetyl-CoA synthase alpha subunit
LNGRTLEKWEIAADICVQLAAARLEERQRKKEQPGPAKQPDRIPACPKCGKPTVLRTAKTGNNAGQQFWGCSAYPACKGLVKL